MSGISLFFASDMSGSASFTAREYMSIEVSSGSLVSECHIGISTGDVSFSVSAAISVPVTLYPRLKSISANG